MIRNSFLLLTLSCVFTVANARAETPGVVQAFVQAHCLDCHGGEEAAAGLNLDRLTADGLRVENANIERWEKVVRRLRARQMPPADSPRPPSKSYASTLAKLETALDRWALKNPTPGRTNSIRRLNRTEYQNSIRDLLALEIDAARLLPADESSHGFDNVTVAELSPALLNRYLAAAQKISRLAVGRAGRSAGGDTFRFPADRTQEEHVPGLPIGTRGGALIPYTFPQDGEYEINIRLSRDRNEEVEGLRPEHELEVLLDRKRIRTFTVRPPADKNHSLVDAHLRTRITVSAGRHQLGVTFPKQPSSLLVTKRQPYHAHYNMHRHPRISPAIFQVSITGPYQAQGPGVTASRKRIFIRRPDSVDEHDACAERILTAMMRRAYRRPIKRVDLERPMRFFRQASEDGDFDAGIELALSSILVSPHFLFRVERDPAGVEATAYRVSDLELATRLSFFLWSSLPDAPLLDAAVAGQLRDPETLAQHVRRMLADDRSSSLVTNFAAQWLYLRNLDATTPDLRRFPDFDDNLRQAFRQETEMFVESILREDRSVLQLIKSDYTYLNERLAKHYGLPHIHGSRFRRVQLSPESKRGGLLRQGGVLTVTSYATRTSPVIRGHWILKNLLGSAPPPPPANVPALKENTVSADLTVRERLAQHRANPACASCHDQMDPIGFALENFDAVGRWRDVESGKPIDASGGLPGHGEFVGVDGLEQALLKNPELFVGTMVEKLLTFALGRGVEYYDAAAVREIVRKAKDEDYRPSALLLGVVQSKPFQMRSAKPPP